MPKRTTRAVKPAGYSGTPLVRKLGLKPGMRVAFVESPSGYSGLLGKLPEGVTVTSGISGMYDFIQVFSTNRQRLATALPAYRRALKPTGMIWLSWPKAAAKVPTDVTETEVRKLGLAAGLVDVKVCAVDATWSGLKFVWRLKDRPAAKRKSPAAR